MARYPTTTPPKRVDRSTLPKDLVVTRHIRARKKTIDRKKRNAQSEASQVDLPKSQRQLTELDTVESNDQKDSGQRKTQYGTQIFTFLQLHCLIHNDHFDFLSTIYN